MYLRHTYKQDYKIPYEVYKQCVWIIRDSDRLSLFANIDKNNPESNFKEDFISDEKYFSIISYKASIEAKHKLEAVDIALQSIPEEYRDGILDMIKKTRHISQDFAHENTWNKWKHIFIANLAKNLNLI